MTDKAKFTKGEWKVRTSVDAESLVGTHTINSAKTISLDEHISNAHLIAVAPEMYLSIQKFIDRVDKREIRSTKTYNEFKSLLKKARGE